jgi:hypothetical protein
VEAGQRRKGQVALLCGEAGIGKSRISKLYWIGSKMMRM